MEAINWIKQFLLYQKIRAKEFFEYKIAIFLWMLSNLFMVLVFYTSMIFASNYSKLFTPEVGTILYLTSILIYDIAHIFIVYHGFFKNDLYLMALTKPYDEKIATYGTIMKRIILIILEVAFLIIAINYFNIHISLINALMYLIYAVLGIFIMVYLINIAYIVSAIINKTDDCAICAIIRNIQNFFAIYPYTIFTDSKIMLGVMAITLAIFYTYEPVKTLLYEPNMNILVIGFVIAVVLYFLEKYIYAKFLKVYETYGG